MSDRTLDVDALLEKIIKPTQDAEIRRILRESAAKKLHPIFEQCQWDNLSETDFLRILPGLVLASELIRCCRALHFWHALRYSREVWETEGSDGTTRRRFHCKYKHYAHLPKSEAKQAEMLADELALWTRLEFGGFEPMKDNMDGVTVAGQHDGPEHHPGVHSKIHINKAKLTNLDLNDLPAAYIRYRWIDLAITLVHEVAHAASYAMRGLNDEGYFEKQIFAEMGFAFEKWMFGGAIFLCKTKAGRVVLGHLQLPNTNMVKLYRAGGMMPTTGDLPSGCDVEATVDEDWVENWFLEDYWRKKVPQSVGKALLPRVIPRKESDLLISEIL